MNQQRLIPLLMMVFFGLMILMVLSSSILHKINPGEKGVLYKPMGEGLVKDKVYGQGYHIIAPWNEMFVYNVQTMEDFESMEVLSKNGLTIKVELSFRYQLTPDKIGYLHDEIGNKFLDKIVKPEIRSATREVIGKYLPEELYSTKREVIQDEIYQRTMTSCAEKHIIVDAILIREVELPQSLQEAIQRKLEEEQASLQMEYLLTKERQEAERRIIEAEAKAEANRILNASLTSNILKDKGIEATIDLAKSPNAKVIVVGGDGDGLPLILGGN